MVIADFEYNTVSGKSAPLIEIGAVRIKGYPQKHGVPAITDEFHTYVNPMGMHITKRITDLTGITADQCKDAPLLTEAMPAFLEWSGNDDI